MLQANQDLSEEATKQRIIEPTLAYLGWDMFGTEVQREYPVDAGGRDEAVDYGLVSEGRPLVLLEAKRLRSPLGDKDAKQVLGYAKLEKIRWCVLTNGRRWKLYNSEWGKDPDEAFFNEWEFNDPSGFPAAVSILSKKSVLEGELDRVAQESMVSQRLLQALNKVLPEFETDLIRAARNMVYAAVHDRFGGLMRSSIENYVRKRLQVVVRSGEAPEKERERPPVATPLKPTEKRDRDERALGLWPLPGGIHSYAESAVAMLEYIASGSPSMDDMVGWIRKRFERAQSEKTIPSYVRVLQTLGLISIDGERIELMSPGQRCLRENSRQVLATQLRDRVAGIEEILVALAGGPATQAELHARVVRELGVAWESPNPMKFRLLWMQNVGLVGEDEGRYRLTDL